MRSYRVAFLCLIVLVTMGIVARSWLHFTGSQNWILPVAVCLGALAYLPVAILGFRMQGFFLQVVAIPAAICFGFLNFLLFATIATWLVLVVSRLAGLGLEPAPVAYALYGAALVILGVGLINAAWVRVTRYTVALENLPREWRDQTIVLVTDVHLGNVRNVAFARWIVRRVNAQHPFAVFIGGDLFDGARVDLDACAAPWGQLQAPAGTYFVTGNHDEFSDFTKILEALRKVGVLCVDDRRLLVRGLQIVGVHDGAAREPAGFGRILAEAAIDRSVASILLNHQPINLPIAEQAGISLQLSGHTHRGQFWPWTILVARIFGPFAYGLNRLKRLQVVTSSGAGTWGPPVRVGSRSEIVKIQLVAA
jgi:predicted MPP superfamily phosphohydrolase